MTYMCMVKNKLMVDFIYNARAKLKLESTRCQILLHWGKVKVISYLICGHKAGLDASVLTSVIQRSWTGDGQNLKSHDLTQNPERCQSDCFLEMVQKGRWTNKLSGPWNRIKSVRMKGSVCYKVLVWLYPSMYTIPISEVRRRHADRYHRVCRLDRVKKISLFSLYHFLHETPMLEF